MPKQLNNLVIFSDTHIGCGLALCHPEGLVHDEGTVTMPSPLQLKLWGMWDNFWNVWVPEVTLGEPYAVCHAGDGIDGAHHNSVTQITQNLLFQVKHAVKILLPVATGAAEYYHLRGSKAHAGESAVREEELAEKLKARPDEEGRFARYELWKRIGGKRGGLVHVMHHIGTTGSSQFESSAVMKELIEAFVEAGRWQDEPPRVVVRAHRHRHLQVRIPSAEGDATSTVTPGWQLKTPFTYKIAGARQSQPQIGGIIVRYHKGELYVRNRVWRVERPKAV